VSKPTKRLVASGAYDPVLARQRIAEWKAKEAGQASLPAGNARPEIRNPNGGAVRPLNPVAAAFPQNGAAPAASPKSVAPVAAQAAPADFDPEVGF
jgi:hypothetical protein